MLSNASSIAKHRTRGDYDNTNVENKIKMCYYVLVLVINSSNEKRQKGPTTVAYIIT